MRILAVTTLRNEAYGLEAKNWVSVSDLAYTMLSQG